MDGDTSVRLLDDESCLNIMNGRMAVTEYGRMGRIESTPGTTSIPQEVFPPYGVHQTIGAVPDNARNRILFFNYNSFSFHGIYCLDYSDTTNPVVYAVLYDSQVSTGLDFSKSFRIDRNASVVGDLLYWTDNNNQPRRINIEAGIKMNHPSYVTTVAPYSYPMNESVIALIRRPFGLALTATKATAGGVTSNFLISFAGRFAARLVYRDSERSVFGSTSAMVNINISTDTFNAIDVAFDILEDFDQDVQIVELAVGYENDPNLFVIKTWNKAVAAEAAQIAAHNAGSTALTYRFFNDKNGIPVGNANSVKQEDAVPPIVKTLTSAINRLMIANYTKGYNTPTQTSLSITQTSSSADVDMARIFKSGSPYQAGVRFRDYSGRKSFVVSTPLQVTTIPDRDYDGLPYVTALNWVLSNAAASAEIPDWAYYYDIVITKNLRTRYFQERLGLSIQYAVGSQGNYTYQQNYNSNVVALAVMPNYDYVFSEGDHIRLYLSITSTIYDLPIIGIDGIWVLFSPVNLGSLTTQPGFVYEIYTPYKASGEETFYTTGQSYLVTNPTTSLRTYSTLSGSILGDSYIQKFTFFTSYRIENMSPNYLVNKDAWFNIYGEPGIQSLFGRVEKPNYVAWSNPIIQGSETNGLSTFDALDEKALPSTMGDINKIQVANKITEEGNIMLAIGAKETASLYLGEVQLVGASANAFIASSPEVVGTINILKGSYGTINPESVVEYLGLVFWLDVLNGCFVQYSQAGLEPISRYKMSRFFKNYCKDYLAASSGNLDNINGFHHIPSGIDPFHKEAFVTVPALIYENYASVLPSYSGVVPSYATSIINRFDISDQLGKRMCFSYEENKFGSNFEGLAEMYAYLQNTMVSFKNGYPFTHNTNITNWNTFYGVEYPLRICVTGNLNASMLKNLCNIACESSRAPSYTVALTAVPNQQITDLAAGDYTAQEGNYYAYFLKDRLSPNNSVGGTADQKLYTGDDLVDFSVFLMVEFSQALSSFDGIVWVQFIDIGYNPSRGQQKIANPINP